MCPAVGVQIRGKVLLSNTCTQSLLKRNSKIIIVASINGHEPSDKKKTKKQPENVHHVLLLILSGLASP